MAEILSAVAQERIGGFSEELDIRDIKGPIKPYQLFFYIIAGLFFTILLGLFSAYLILKIKKRKIKLTSSLSAYETTYNALEDLKKKGLIKKGKIEEYHIELSDIIRQYLESKFEIKASTMTIEEFLINFKGANNGSFEYKRLLRDFLMHCDMVKFARYEPSGDEIEQSFRSARELIKITE
jgi:hypothetical protein